MISVALDKKRKMLEKDTLQQELLCAVGQELNQLIAVITETI